MQCPQNSQQPARTSPRCLRETLERLTPAARTAAVARLGDAQARALLDDWYLRSPEHGGARIEQVPPDGDWSTWLCCAGRGWGKTCTGAEWTNERARTGARYIALVAPTAADARDVMVEGPAGILARSRDGERPIYEPSKRQLTWPNGAIAKLYSAEEPDRLRGPQHDTAWCDELASWKNADATWDMLQFGMRLGEPKRLVTTTPRPIQIVRELLADPTCVVVRGSTYDNAANLAPDFLAGLRRKYEGSRLGRQELFAELLDDTPGALWTRALIDKATARDVPELRRIVVAIDPSVAADGGGDECGIVVAGVDYDGALWVIRDGSGNLSPSGWAARAVSLAETHQADAIVAEANNGGALVETTLRAFGARGKIKLVHASRGKRSRAEPVSALYEQGKARHARGLATLEDELCTWSSSSGDPSPNRLDALVWAAFDLCNLATPERVATESEYQF
jgi:phage terminase large subunit-like protein